MKRLLLVMLFLGGIHMVGISQNGQKQVQSNVPPSDASPNGYTYDWDKGYAAITDYILNPTGSNQEAKKLVDRKDFPKLNPAEKSISTIREKEIKAWMESHSKDIIDAFKQRSDIVTAY